MPHTSLRVPKCFYKGLTISKNEFNKYNLEMTDLGIDELFGDFKGIRIRAKYSRMFCDVERFLDDSIEVMSKYGQGVVYSHTYDNKLFHIHNDKYKKRVIRYYKNYHKRFDDLVKRITKKEDVLILDLHSFSYKSADQFNDGNYPDVCIGVEENYYSEEILNKIIEKIKQMGFSYKINYLYKGSIVPNYVFKNKTKHQVISFMLEINKRVYL